MRQALSGAGPTTSAGALGAHEVTERSADTAPLVSSDTDRAFADLSAYDHLIIAVSGGADSLALMYLVADWLQRQAMPMAKAIVVTVDHGLRPESAAEALWVAKVAASLGLAHVIKTYSGPQPTAPVAQSWARTLRYQLLSEVAETERGLDGRAAILTAHHLDDQAETVLMRLSRGSGVHGLGGIRPVRTLRPRVDLVRPLLAVPKLRLKATLQTKGATWLEDPSNANQRFERVRMRTLEPTLIKLGLQHAALARVAHRAARASVALDTAVVAAFQQQQGIRVDDLGFAWLDWPLFLSHPAEIRLRIMAQALAWLSANPDTFSLGQLENMTEAVAWAMPAGLTFYGCALVQVGAAGLVMVPELFRLPAADAALTPVRFGPFSVHQVAPGGPGNQIGPLADDGIKTLKDQAHPLPDLPRKVLQVQPALRSPTGNLLSVPTLGFAADRLVADLATKPGTPPDLRTRPTGR